MPTLSGSGNNKNKRWLFHNPTDFIILLLLALALFAIGFSVNEVFISKNGVFDENVFAFISPFVTASRTEFFQFISFFGKHSFLIPAYLVLLACY